MDGSAMLMRGKSTTCRRRAYLPQVFDLPLRSQTANSFRASVRQVADLPRIGMAEP